MNPEAGPMVSRLVYLSVALGAAMFVARFFAPA
jgi:hypothetical protein